MKGDLIKTYTLLECSINVLSYSVFNVNKHFLKFTTVTELTECTF